MTYEQEFLKAFEEWLNTQVMVNDMAKTESENVYDTYGDDKAKEAIIRYESRLDAYRFLQGKFANYHQRKDFHDLPDHSSSKRHY
ncbi:DUF1912 family protein [Streptococcus zalophi]|uniref:DUF1912 family protein n=1 Tax=Streptococcus zalophi TaxID=640031 RepID=A0A934UDN0_9STRE|nr:DUF1912 family protein [Streptococcus zalophi]MBJ8349848.1 DUF1912 family protein [Streptococcus zalophi]MCR8967615.1 DUF1912 family protein [Streptococcus zalophi]